MEGDGYSMNGYKTYSIYTKEVLIPGKRKEECMIASLGPHSSRELALLKARHIARAYDRDEWVMISFDIPDDLWDNGRVEYLQQLLPQPLQGEQLHASI